MAVNKRQKEMLEAQRRIERDKASGNKPIKKTVLNNNKETVTSYIEDRPKRLEAKIGSPRKDDAQITYQNKKFNKRKKTKDGGNFEWDGNMLKGLSTKRYGKSYAAKFESLANEAGIPDNQRGAFKDYLDAKEYKANPVASMDDARFENDRNVAQLQKKNEAEKKRAAILKTPEGIKEQKKKSQGFVGNGLDFLASMTAFDDKGYQREQEKKKKEGTKQSGVERFATRSVNKANLGIPEQLEKRATGETPEYATSRKFGEGGGTDIMSDLLGYLAPGVGVTKALRGTKLGADVSKGALTKAGALTRAKEGAAVGALMSSAEVGARESLNPEDYNWKQNAMQIGLETAGGALFDPAIGAIGAGLKKGATNSIQGAIKSTNEDLITRMLQGTGDIPRMASPIDNMAPQNPLEDLIKRSQGQNVQAPRLDIPDTKGQGDQALANYTKQYEDAQALAQQTRQQNSNPLGLTDYEPNFTMRDSSQLRLEAPEGAFEREGIKALEKEITDMHVQARQMVDEAFPDADEVMKSQAYEQVMQTTNIAQKQGELNTLRGKISPLDSLDVKDKIAHWKNPSTPRTESDVRMIVKEMENIEPQIKQFEDNLPNLRETEISKDPTVASIHARSKELLNESAEAEQSWSVIKQVQDQFRDPKTRPEWAKFSLDSQLRNSEESGLIPTRFVAKGEDANYGIDFAKAKDLAGFEDDVAFIQHLQFINDQLNTTRKSLSTLGIKDSKDAARQLESFEKMFDDDLRGQYGISELQGQLDELSSLATPYEPPVNPVQDMMFKTTQRTEVPRDPITEIVRPNAQYGMERGSLDSPRSPEAAATTLEAPVRTGSESLGIEQAPSVAQVEPKMVRVKQQENIQAQATNVVVNDAATLKTLISQGTKESEQYAERIIDSATKSPVMRAFRKVRQALVGSGNSATYAERNLLKREVPRAEARLKDAKVKSETSKLSTDAWETTRLEMEVDDLKRRLKDTLDTGSVQKALEIEEASNVKSAGIGNEFVTKLNNVADTTLAESSEWQLAKRFDWIRTGDKEKGIAPRALPKWMDARVNEILANDKPAFRETEKIYREMQELRLELLEKGGNKSKAEIERLKVEPYYVPAYVDESVNVARNGDTGKPLKGQPSSSRMTSSDITTIKAFENDNVVGDPFDSIRNPVDSILDDLFSEGKSIARNNTAHQLRNLADIDDLGPLIGTKQKGKYVTKVDKTKFEREGGAENPKFLKGYDKGEPFYLEIHPEFQKMLKDNDAIEKINGFQYMTSMMSRLKTTSPEYQMTAIIRDLATSFIYSSNGRQYASGLLKVATDADYRKMGYDAGVHFQNAFDQQSAANQGSEQLQKQIREMAGFTDVDATNVEKVAGTLSKGWDKVFKPLQKLGQISDDVPRLIEANITKNKWETKILSKTREAIAKIEAEIPNAPKDDFVDGNVAQLEQRLEILKTRLETQTKSMEQDITHRGRDVMNYKRVGGSGMAKAFKKYVNFANTTTQSKDKFARSFMRDPVGVIARSTVVMAPMIAYAKYSYDNLTPEEQDEYDAIEPYMKQQRIIIPRGGGQYISLPKPQEVAILTNFVDASMGIMSFEDALDYSVKEVTPMQLGGMTQGLLDGSRAEGGLSLKNFRENMVLPGTVASPLLDIGFNTKSSFNRKPVSYSREGESGDYTMDLFDKMTGGTDWADAAQYGTLQYGGDYGKYAANAMNMMLSPSGEGSSSEGKAQNVSDGKKALNPFQDYFYSPDSEWFRKMNYNKDKLPK